MSYKTVQDPVHGSVKFTGPFLELLETPELQRLHGIKQLGLTKLVFPGANHTRLEHSIGTYHVARRMASSLELEDDEEDMVKAAALLHDIGHAPLSHTLEGFLERSMDRDHMDITKDMITGDISLEPRKTPSIPDILEQHDISPEGVAELIKGEDDHTQLTDFSTHQGQKYFGEERYLPQMIHGPMDADQIDYLLRDSHYTGAVHGVVDIERLLQTIEIHNGDLAVMKGGIPALEGMLVARGLMYSSVYLHKTARIAELMLTKAVEGVDMDLEEVQFMTDWELLCQLRDKGDFAAEVVQRLKFRDLYKKCFSLERDELKEAAGIDEETIGELSELKSLENDIARASHLESKRVIVDVPHRELKLSEPRLHSTGIKIIEEDRLYELSKFSPLARALQRRPSQPWAIMVSCLEDKKEDVREAAERKILG